MSSISAETAISTRLMAIADDNLLLSQRNSAWCGQAPVSTRGNTLSRIALDQIIQAQMWYALAARLTGDKAAANNGLPPVREAGAYLSAALVELPNQTWTGSLLREYLFDRYETTLLRCLLSMDHDAIKDAAGFLRRRKVEHAHQTHSALRELLAQQPDQRAVVQTELDHLWPLALALFEVMPGERDLMKHGSLPDLFHQEQVWIEAVQTELIELGLVITGPGPEVPSRLVGSPYRGKLIEQLAEASRSRSRAAI